jgi:hypothetical protein
MSPDPILSWRSWPFIDRPLASVLLSAFLCFLAFYLWHLAVVSWNMPWYYILGMLLVFGSLLPYFIPTTYHLFEHEVIVWYLFLKVTRRYEDFGCFYSDKKGIMLSTFKIPRRLDVFRGQSLRYSQDQSEKEKLIEILSAKIGKRY